MAIAGGGSEEEPLRRPQLRDAPIGAEHVLFEKNFVLKAALVLIDADVAFKVGNFNRQNIGEIERRWDDISEALRISVELIARNGFNGYSLLTNNALIPIAYYLFRSGQKRSFLDSSKDAPQRELIRRWLATVILQQTFGGQTDSILRWIREAMASVQDGFPVEAIEARLAREGRSLKFAPDELEALLDFSYTDRYTFSILSLLYPGLAVVHPDVDHVHPRGLFGNRELQRLGIPESDWPQYQISKERLGNLQLLEGTPNREKSDKPFHEWLKEEFPRASDREAYMRRNLIPDVDLGMTNFLEFKEERDKLILKRLADLTK